MRAPTAAAAPAAASRRRRSHRGGEERPIWAPISKWKKIPSDSDRPQDTSGFHSQMKGSTLIGANGADTSLKWLGTGFKKYLILATFQPKFKKSQRLKYSLLWIVLYGTTTFPFVRVEARF